MENGIDLDSDLRSERLSLTPLIADHADELFPLLDDTRLHAFTGGTPSSRDELRERYATLSSRRSPDGQELWLNWIVRRNIDRAPVGTLQASVAGSRASVAWVISVRWQGRGYAGEAAATAVRWLFDHLGVDEVEAYIHPDHIASQRVAMRAGLDPTPRYLEGERVWRARRLTYQDRGDPGPPQQSRRLH